jgi:hypothetical protein
MPKIFAVEKSKDQLSARRVKQSFVQYFLNILTAWG